MSLRTRVSSLERRLPRPVERGPSKVVEVLASDGPPIEWASQWWVTLRDPPTAWEHPEEALSDEQRELIGPSDKVVIICGEHPEGLSSSL